MPSRKTVGIEPLYDRVIIKRIDDDEESLILLPDTAKEKPQTGEVIAIGTGRFLSVGDRVLFGKYSGNEIKFDGQELLILKEEEVLARLRQEFLN